MTRPRRPAPAACARGRPCQWADRHHGAHRLHLPVADRRACAVPLLRHHQAGRRTLLPGAHRDSGGAFVRAREFLGWPEVAGWDC